jgi:hypothetical protein
LYLFFVFLPDTTGLDGRYGNNICPSLDVEA